MLCNLVSWLNYWFWCALIFKIFVGLICFHLNLVMHIQWPIYLLQIQFCNCYCLQSPIHWICRLSLIFLTCIMSRLLCQILFIQSLIDAVVVLEANDSVLNSQIIFGLMYFVFLLQSMALCSIKCLFSSRKCSRFDLSLSFFDNLQWDYLKFCCGSNGLKNCSFLWDISSWFWVAMVITYIWNRTCVRKISPCAWTSFLIIQIFSFVRKLAE